MTQQSPSAAGRFVWHDMMTKDLDRSLAFYSALFGWRITAADTGDPPYRMIHLGDRPIGGMLPLDRSSEIPSHWIGYVTTDDIHASLGRVTTGRVEDWRGSP